MGLRVSVEGICDGEKAIPPSLIFNPWAQNMTGKSEIAETDKSEVTAEEAAEVLRRHDDLLIVSHVRPDGDCIGSMLGLFFILRKLGKRVATFNVDPIPEKWDFVPGIENVASTLPEWTPSITVFVDCGGVKRVSDDFQPIGVVLNIDHHLTNTRFGDYNYIDVNTSAVGQQIYNILQAFGAELTPEIATVLYLSMMTDTGGFRYSNATPESFRVAARLAEAGADVSFLAQQVYETRTREEVALAARVMGNLHFEADGAMVWAELRGADYERFGGYENEPDGLSSEIRGIKGVEVSCLMHETEEGWLRAGFRGKGNVDCSAIAASVGGGGHFNAAGVFIKGVRYEEARERILDAMRKAMNEWQTKRP